MTPFLRVLSRLVPTAPVAAAIVAGMVGAATMIGTVPDGAAQAQQAPAPQAPTQQAPAQQGAPRTAPGAQPHAPQAQPPQAQPAPAQPQPAQPPKPPAPKKPDDAQQQKLDAWKAELDQIVAALQRNSLNDRALADLRNRTDAIKVQANEVVDSLSPTLQGIEARLKQIGPAPENEDDNAESEAIRQDREQQQKALADVQGRVKQAQLVMLRSDEIVKQIGDRRRARFAQELLERSRSVFDPTLWLSTLQAVPGLINAFGLLLGDWLRLLAVRGMETTAVFGGTLVAIFAVVALTRRTLIRLTVRESDVAAPSLLARSAKATGIVAFNVAVPVVTIIAVSQALEAFELSPSRVSALLTALAFSLGSAASIYGLGLGLLAPGKAAWRMLPLRDGAAQGLQTILIGISVVHGTGIFLTRLLDVLFAPVTSIIAVTGIVALIDTMLVMIALRTLAGALSGDDETAAEGSAPVASDKPRSVFWRWIVPIAWIAAAVTVTASAIGYVALAHFMATQIIRAGAILALLYLLLLLADELLISVFRPQTALGHMLTRSMGLARETVEQIGVVLSGIVRLLLIATAALLLLTPWGVSSDDVMSQARTAFFGFKIGGLTISLSTILTGLALLAIGIGVTRGIQGWLDTRFLPRTRLDSGLKNSIRTSFGYVGVVLAVMFAFSAAGLDLQNLAIVAGALSVGIGFGLQSIVNNFVSGLILLVERPIKAGDLVEIGKDKGFVRKINVRSTEIETGDRASLIVPNSSLISGNVKNWMHRDLTGNAVVNVGVTYDADPDKVKEILIASAKGHKLVLPFPGPSCFFTAFGESSLEFRLICTVGNVNDSFGVESDLRFEIVRRLREGGIDIPFAQRDIHIAQLDHLRELADAYLGRPLSSLAPRPPVEPEKPAG
ncbi:DUF3772 domain-containing protein [Methyloraptor flagellatus]|uniref:DUF3772 domain-containing protein n=1 Tax=Methyloraptor flagellatus TaxID=3162530 RepID=A0AAU7X9F8_9HYPH